jgi:hypothetical protein
MNQQWKDWNKKRLSNNARKIDNEDSGSRLVQPVMKEQQLIAIRRRPTMSKTVHRDSTETDDNRQHRMWSRCWGQTDRSLTTIVLTGNSLSHHRAINSSMGINWRSCSSNTVLRTLTQNTSIGTTCVNINSRTWGASIKVA